MNIITVPEVLVKSERLLETRGVISERANPSALLQHISDQEMLFSQVFVKTFRIFFLTNIAFFYNKIGLYVLYFFATGALSACIKEPENPVI